MLTVSGSTGFPCLPPCLSASECQRANSSFLFCCCSAVAPPARHNASCCVLKCSLARKIGLPYTQSPLQAVTGRERRHLKAVSARKPDHSRGTCTMDHHSAAAHSKHRCEATSVVSSSVPVKVLMAPLAVDTFRPFKAANALCATDAHYFIRSKRSSSKKLRTVIKNRRHTFLKCAVDFFYF